MVIRHEHGRIYFHQERDGWYIDSITVDDGWRGKWIGTQLMKEALKQCGSPIFLYASEELGGDIKRLKHFYNRFGFRTVTQKKYDIYPYKYNMALEE